MKSFIAIAAVVFVLSGAAWAQQGPGPGGRGIRGKGPMYDPAKAETLTGQVAEVKELTSRNGMRQGVGLMLKSGDKTVLVHLGPKFYIDQQAVKIAAGDTVEVTGVKAERMGQDVFMAGQVKKNGAVLKLRDETGRPLWAGTGPAGAGPAGKAPAGGKADQPKAAPKAPVGC
jgi:hypothetical protein